MEFPIDNLPFATRDLAAFAPLFPPARAAGAGIDLAYWTEAAIFSGAGIDAIVYGPGDIAQAHAPDEFVAIADLEQARRDVEALLEATRR